MANTVPRLMPFIIHHGVIAYERPSLGEGTEDEQTLISTVLSRQLLCCYSSKNNLYTNNRGLQPKIIYFIWRKGYQLKELELLLRSIESQFEHPVAIDVGKQSTFIFAVYQQTQWRHIPVPS